jgi:hypothetical protein
VVGNDVDLTQHIVRVLAAVWQWRKEIDGGVADDVLSFLRFYVSSPPLAAGRWSEYYTGGEDKIDWSIVSSSTKRIPPALAARR